MTASYALHAVVWIVILAGAGVAVRPLINRLDKERDR